MLNIMPQYNNNEQQINNKQLLFKRKQDIRQAL
jgi:hypothetical protein